MKNLENNDYIAKQFIKQFIKNYLLGIIGIGIIGGISIEIFSLFFSKVTISIIESLFSMLILWIVATISVDLSLKTVDINIDNIKNSKKYINIFFIILIVLNILFNIGCGIVYMESINDISDILGLIMSIIFTILEYIVMIFLSRNRLNKKVLGHSTHNIMCIIILLIVLICEMVFNIHNTVVEIFNINENNENIQLTNKNVSKENITFTPVFETNEGLIVKILNKNEYPVYLQNIKTDYGNSIGELLKIRDQYVFVDGNSETYIIIENYGKYGRISNIQFEFEIFDSSPNFIFNGIEFNINKNSNTLGVTIKNNSHMPIKGIAVSVVYYKNDIPIAVKSISSCLSQSSYTETLAYSKILEDEEAYMNIKNPDVDFDNYKIYLKEARKGSSYISADEKERMEEIKKLNIEKAGISENGKFIVKVTNTNNKGICGSLYVLFRDSNNNFKFYKEIKYGMKIAANTDTYVYLDKLENEEYSDFLNYEFMFKSDPALTWYTDESGYFDYEHEQNGEYIDVSINTKNIEDSVLSLHFNVVFYYENKIIDIKGSNIMISSNKNTILNIEIPKDENDNNIKFDKYEVYPVYTKNRPTGGSIDY